MKAAASRGNLDLSIIAPARNEEGNISKFIEQVAKAFIGSRVNFELIIVEDRSMDRTLEVAREGMRLNQWLRVLRIREQTAKQCCGKSSALLCGVEAARGEYLAFIDADGQNAASDLLPMFQLLKGSKSDMVHGDRSGHRHDTWLRRFSSVAASWLRRMLLRDEIRDSACGLLLMSGEVAKKLPLQFAGIHRFLPCYAKISGFKVIQVPVTHHPRIAGKPKYGFCNRLLPSLIDMLVLRWMRNRFQVHSSDEIILQVGTRLSDPGCVR